MSGPGPISGGGRISGMLRNAIAPVLLLAVLLLLVVLRYGPAVDASRATSETWQVPRAPAPTLQVGVSTEPLARNSWQAWKPGDLNSVDAFERAAHRHADVVMFYADWEHAAFSPEQLQVIAARGSIPEITWEPWDAGQKLNHPQPRYRLGQIIDGRFDAYIREWAAGLAEFGQPVRLRFAQEMNGFWYPWSETGNGNHHGEFVRAWQHVHDIFRAAGAGNVEWVWTPVSGAPAAYFPGERYVDRLGLTCLNGGPHLSAHGWRSLAQICGDSVAALHTLAPSLPIEISELGSSEDGGSKAAWIAGAGRFLSMHPEIRSAVWFNLAKETDWRIQSSPGAAQAAIAAFGDGRDR